MSEICEPKITVIGGGTGSLTLLEELKYLTPNPAAVVNMSDDGGSSGRLRQQYGVLPPGDVRQCLTALSTDEEARDVFRYRYSDGALEGHAVGNLLLARFEMTYGFKQAVKLAGILLGITGKVVPVTLDKHDLALGNGTDTVRGEFAVAYSTIDDHSADLYLEPEAKINPEAEAALYEADLAVIAPGNLYGSLLPALIVDGVAGAFQNTNARKLIVTNLLNTPNQTADWHVVDYLKRVERVLGEGTIDDVLYNNQLPSDQLLGESAKPGEKPVQIEPKRFSEVSAHPIGDNLLANQIFVPDGCDTLVPRTKIRHDATRVGEHIMQLARK